VITSCTDITWLDGNTYTSSNNTATFTTTNSAGCDSVITLNFTKKESTSSTDEISSCNAITWLDGNTYAGGGGAACDQRGSTPGNGGTGGGGNATSNSTGQPGTDNTGGGGGGGNLGNSPVQYYSAGNGGSGVVIIRYLGAQKGSGGTVTSSGGYTYHTFNSSGTYTA
jgi:hypothetical protein